MYSIESAPGSADTAQMRPGPTAYRSLTTARAGADWRASAYNYPMSFSPINALSPLDGRYAAKLGQLRPLMSEQGYMHRRVQVEVTWFIVGCQLRRIQATKPGRAHLSARPGQELLGSRRQRHQGH